MIIKGNITAVTTTTSETGISFAVRHIEEYKAVVSYSGAVATGTYTFSVQVSDLVGGTYTTIADVVATPANASDRFDIPLSGKIAEQLDADSAFIRVTATLGGTSPSVDYDCFITKV